MGSKTGYQRLIRLFLQSHCWRLDDDRATAAGRGHPPPHRGARPEIVVWCGAVKGDKGKGRSRCFFWRRRRRWMGRRRVFVSNRREGWEGDCFGRTKKKLPTAQHVYICHPLSRPVSAPGGTDEKESPQQQVGGRGAQTGQEGLRGEGSGVSRHRGGGVEPLKTAEKGRVRERPKKGGGADACAAEWRRRRRQKRKNRWRTTDRHNTPSAPTAVVALFGGKEAVKI